MDDRPDTEHTVPLLPLPAGRQARRRERRVGLATLVSALACEIGTRRDSALHATFEESLSKLVPARTVRLRELAATGRGFYG